MNIAQIEDLGRRLQDTRASSVSDAAHRIDRLVNGTSTTWAGPDAERFRGWWPDKRSRMLAMADDLSRFGQSALKNASEQREASGAASVGGGTGALSVGGTTTRPFESRGGGRADIVEAFWATGDGRRAGFDEIEIRRLDNDRFVVVLPGVVDLTANLGDVGVGALQGDAVGPWYDGEQPDTVRRMEYAIGESRDSADSFVNPYAQRVIEVMEASGIPEGANVMLMGHSFGAYTAMELAGNEMFNSIDGSSAGYHVNVTHVISAGADTNWKLGELPSQTNVLVLNNRYDLAFRAEDPLQPDLATQNDRQVNIEFFGEPAWKDGSGFGHDPANYVKFLEDAHDCPELNAWLDGAGSMYGGSGSAISAKVPDY